MLRAHGLVRESKFKATRNFYKKKNTNLINTNKLFPELLTLPMHPDISKKEANYIVNTLLKTIPSFC